MWITQLSLKNIRGFIDTGLINFSRNINIFVGPNNSGKSTILNAISLLNRQTFNMADVSLNKTNGRVEVFFQDFDKVVQLAEITKHPSAYSNSIHLVMDQGKVYYQIPRKNDTNTSNALHFSPIPSIEPDNVIYPYLSKRKVVTYSEDINSKVSNNVTGNFQNLFAKVDRLSNPHFLPGFVEYQEACENIIGFPITAIASQGGKKAALIVKNLQHIPLTSMGEGVANLLGLIVDLCIAENQIFLIEEPENDIHPKALKSLLNLIEKKSETNQFFISTHSNIVTKYLGGLENSKIFKVQMNFSEGSRLPISNIKQVPNNPLERQRLLEELGYEFHDYDLWKAWLFLEESSAEEIIRDFLIPLFIPGLAKRLRTYSSRTVNEMEIKFKDFNNLFVFLHLEPQYKNKAWVILDAGKNEEEILNKMKEYYLKAGWNEDNFLQFKQHDFERYYPKHFKKEVEAIAKITDKREKREQKASLLNHVKEWIDDNKEEAKKQFTDSAKEVIAILKTIDKATK